MAPGTFSSVGSGPIWRRFMIDAHSYLQLPPKPFTIPDSIIQASCGGRTEVFKKDTPTVKNGACRGPSGSGGETETPTPRGPVFPTKTATPTPAPTETPQRPTVFYYTVRQGDTLELVAELFSVDLADLLEINGLVEGEQIYPGDILIIPGTPNEPGGDDGGGGAEGGVIAPNG
jgi:LysM repeat protein